MYAIGESRRGMFELLNGQRLHIYGPSDMLYLFFWDYDLTTTEIHTSC